MINRKSKAIYLILIILFLMTTFVTYLAPEKAQAETAYDHLALQAVKAQYNSYQNGAPVNGGGYIDFCAYDAYILDTAGADVNTWVYDNTSLKTRVMTLIDAAIANPNETTTDSVGKVVYASSAKSLTQGYLAAKTWKEPEADQLLTILKNRQTVSGFDNNAFSDIPAFEMIGRAGVISELDATNAITYILANQDAATGAWTTSWHDFQVTAQAVRALYYLKNQPGVEAAVQTTVQTAIDGGLNWMKALQQPDGSFQDTTGFDYKVVDTAEAIYTLKLLGAEESSTWVKAADYMNANALADGSFGNIGCTTSALDAYLKLGGSIDANINSGTGGIVPDKPSNNIIVSIAVVGKDGNLLYRPGSVQISKNDEFGLTAMSALDATRLSYELSDRNDGMVISIEGQENEGMNGWCGKVNSTNFWDIPREISVTAGDKIIFWYSMDANFNGPQWDDLLSGNIVQITTSTALKDEMKETLNSYSEELNKLLKAVASKTATSDLQILNTDKKMTQDAAQVLKEELDNNTVAVSESVDGTEAVLGDTEVSMLVPENALSQTKKLTITELAPNQEPEQCGIKLGSSTYEFGPTGTKFDKPVTISLKIPITEDMNIANLTPAWYDEESHKWIPIPAVIDLKTGLVVFQIDHFTKFALIELPEVIKEARVTFTDVNEDIAWAKDAIEILAGKGIISGTGQELFEPQRPISRSEFVKLAVTALQLKTENYKNGQFNDVYASNWFAAAVATAYNNRIIAGYPDGSFKPDNRISRNEIASIIYRIEGPAKDISDVKLAYNDQKEIPTWTLNGVRFTYKHGLMSGYEDGTFRGDKPLTRAEAAVVIYKYVDLVQKFNTVGAVGLATN